ncbi:hypothetical protein LSH36_242g02006 [Paralvinella palmiformis]|uniref:PBZ-type domain-containing protein n=1 Tax=Paralvinella palmiformis TaxID=53620 RepID=A0AAD9JLL3_9ANNE|nr:hypothetical protein LSH36_242g02006 [Paralvinella palmiformis]
MSKYDDKPICKYGAKCYRKNRKHLEEYMHPDDKDESTEPEKKKAKIDQFFTKKGSVNKCDQDTGGESDDVKDNETSTVAGQCSGYIRDPESSTQEESETSEDPPSPADIRENIKQKFLMEMPDDFYNFWEFSKTLNDTNPTDALKSTLGLVLVGPYDVLDGKHKTVKHPCYLRHWRYYYDPPEFMTIIKGDDKTQFHFGYYR